MTGPRLGIAMSEDQAALQAKVQQLQAFSGQLQQVAQQRAQMEAMVAESKHAVQALQGLDADATVYRNIGSLLVQDTGRDAALARIQDDLETMEIRVKRAKDQETQLRERLDTLQKELQANFQ